MLPARCVDECIICCKKNSSAISFNSSTISLSSREAPELTTSAGQCTCDKLKSPHKISGNGVPNLFVVSP